MAPLLSVVVCTYNRAQLLRECLESMVAQTAASRDFEVVVVDNASNDDTKLVIEEFVGKHAHFRGVYEDQQGLSHARNRGWREARGVFVAFIDDDAHAGSDWCDCILKTVEQQDLAVMGGPILPRLVSTPPSWFDERLERRDWGMSPGYLEPPLAQFGFSGSNMVIRRSLLETFKGFRTDLGMSAGEVALGEETEFFMKVYPRHPRFWYEPRLVVTHWTPARNWQVRYRLLRAFRKGEAHALIAGHSRSALIFFVRKLVTSPYHLARLIRSRTVKGDSYRLQVLIAAEEFAHRAGLLTQAVRMGASGHPLAELARSFSCSERLST